MQGNSVTNAKSSRRTLIIVLLLFILPAIGASLMYAIGWKPSHTVNHGVLIVPAKPIADHVLQSLDGKPVKFSELHGKWTMIYFDNANCDENCMKQIFFMRQIHLSQGKNIERLQRVYILTETSGIESLKAKLAEYPEMLVLKGDQPVISSLVNEFGIDQKTAHANNIYLMDHLGNFMMRYKADTEPAGMRKDIERLLKYSSDK
jgi:cytochrome oxidase Cu insertion factor (SCO1/SenC/PrrC family)